LPPVGSDVLGIPQVRRQVDALGSTTGRCRASASVSVAAITQDGWADVAGAASAPEDPGVAADDPCAAPEGPAVAPNDPRAAPVGPAVAPEVPAAAVRAPPATGAPVADPAAEPDAAADGEA